MSNRIDSNLQGLLDKSGQKVNGTGRGSRVEPGKAAETNAGGKSGVTDTVELTERSQLMARLEKEIARTPAIDRARVDAVKADLESGKYEIDLDNLAELLLRSELDAGE